jgi:putative spermidine/putrescine transport system permease protein
MAPTKLERLLYRRPHFLTAALLLLPLAWLLVVYEGSLAVLLFGSLFTFDDFSGSILPILTLDNYRQVMEFNSLLILWRTIAMSAFVTLGAIVIALPVAYVAAKYVRGRAKALFYVAVTMPMWSSYLVKVYAWKLILAKEGVITWAADSLSLGPALSFLLALPVIGGPSLSLSYIGTFLVFVYLWTPMMILPVQNALERVPKSLMEASSDLGATRWQTLRRVTLPLAMPGIAAGSIFTFSLTLGDYIAPQIVGNSRPFIGQAVFALQGTAGNIPLAAAFSVMPIIVMGIYLRMAKKLGAFDAL